MPANVCFFRFVLKAYLVQFNFHFDHSWTCCVRFSAATAVSLWSPGRLPGAFWATLGPMGGCWFDLIGSGMRERHSLPCAPAREAVQMRGARLVQPKQRVAVLDLLEIMTVNSWVNLNTMLGWLFLLLISMTCTKLCYLVPE